MVSTGPRRNRRSILKAAGALGVMLGFGGGVASADDEDEPERTFESKERELLVGVSPSVSDMKATVRSALSEDAKIVHSNETIRYVAVELPEGYSESEQDQIVAALESAEEIDYVEENRRAETVAVEPDDEHYSAQYAPEQINAPEAWETTLGSTDVMIAIIDQGVHYTHEELDHVHDIVGNNFVDSGSDPMPTNVNEDHGTKVAGVACGKTDNGTGHAGISNCTYISARALGADGSGMLSDIADATQWATDQGADIINMSLATDSHSETLHSAVQYAMRNDTLPIVAAGNDGGSVRYPAAYDSTVAVSAVSANETLADFSSRGPEVDLTAPGVQITTSTVNNNYAQASGTSLASPVVSGVAGLVKTVNPDLSASEIRNVLVQTAEDIGLSSNKQGHGQVNAAAAVQNAHDEPEGRVIRFDGSFQSEDDYTPTNYHVEVSDELTPSMYKGASIDPELDMGSDKSTVDHVVKDHMDSFEFEGSIISLEVDDGPADVYVDGQKINPDTFTDDGGNDDGEDDDGRNDDGGNDDGSGDGPNNDEPNNDGGDDEPNNDGGDDEPNNDGRDDDGGNDDGGNDDGGNDDGGFDFGGGDIFDEFLDTDYWNNLFDQFGIDFRF